MMEAGLQDFPESWKKSIYAQAAEASAKVLKRKRDTEPEHPADTEKAPRR